MEVFNGELIKKRKSVYNQMRVRRRDLEEIDSCIKRKTSSEKTSSQGSEGGEEEDIELDPWRKGEGEDSVQYDSISRQSVASAPVIHRKKFPVGHVPTEDTSSAPVDEVQQLVPRRKPTLDLPANTKRVKTEDLELNTDRSGQ